MSSKESVSPPLVTPARANTPTEAKHSAALVRPQMVGGSLATYSAAHVDTARVKNISYGQGIGGMGGGVGGINILVGHTVKGALSGSGGKKGTSPKLLSETSSSSPSASASPASSLPQPKQFPEPKKQQLPEVLRSGIPGHEKLRSQSIQLPLETSYNNPSSSTYSSRGGILLPPSPPNNASSTISKLSYPRVPPDPRLLKDVDLPRTPPPTATVGGETGGGGGGGLVRKLGRVHLQPLTLKKSSV